MAIAEERGVVSVSETSPLNDDEDLFIEEYDDDVGGCGCFRGLCSGWRRRGRYLLEQEEEEEEAEKVRIRESWLRERGKRIKEFSEMVAGPKWKNFIRRFSVDISNGKRRRTKTMQFQYDPQSYKLNFDDGVNGEIHIFSARYAGSVRINGGELKI